MEVWYKREYSPVRLEELMAGARHQFRRKRDASVGVVKYDHAFNPTFCVLRVVHLLHICTRHPIDSTTLTARQAPTLHADPSASEPGEIAQSIELSESAKRIDNHGADIFGIPEAEET